MTHHRQPEKQVTFVLTLRAMPGAPGIRALRRFLKVALRSFRLRCISAKELRR